MTREILRDSAYLVILVNDTIIKCDSRIRLIFPSDIFYVVKK